MEYKLCYVEVHDLALGCVPGKRTGPAEFDSPPRGWQLNNAAWEVTMAAEMSRRYLSHWEIRFDAADQSKAEEIAQGVLEVLEKWDDTAANFEARYIQTEEDS